ncbi:hypothetical protein JI735_28465 [Paenibacillus sonchi]|uniref:Uncharacterized protein n=1 Tax=Paenibacillus sonchi TaxID=373687 RepID=A0A974PBF4_9BACL|nr:hypothetical protein [Paenibacillus sonchi]QQZ60396.1 hypothetical protein JI735_28465 [Paenibacillus sonchi]
MFNIAIKELPKRRQNIQFANPSCNIAIFHNEGFVEHEIDVEVQRAVVLCQFSINTF